MRTLFLVLVGLFRVVRSGDGSLSHEENVRVQKSCGHLSYGLPSGNFKFAIGGYSAPLLPYAVRLYYGQVACEGTLITTRHVLTAAHCVYSRHACPLQNFAGPSSAPKVTNFNQLDRYAFSSAESWRAVLGSTCRYSYCGFPSGAFELGVRRVIANARHPLNGCRGSDIAIVELDRDVMPHEVPKPACVATLNDTISGLNFAFGRGENPLALRENNYELLFQLRIVKLQATQCPRFYPEDVLCTSEIFESTCSGDSGGGFMQHSPQGRAYVFGITSFGQRCDLVLENRDLNYAKNTHPGGSTDVRLYAGWICQTIGLCPASLGENRISSAQSMEEDCDPIGQWSEWLPWVECVEGETQIRERGCLPREDQREKCGNSPVTCPGEDMDYRPCRGKIDEFPEGVVALDQQYSATLELEPCDYEGSWSEWGPWEISTEGGDIKKRIRSCIGLPEGCRPLIGFNCTEGSYIEYESDDDLLHSTVLSEASSSRVSPHLPPTSTTPFYDPNCVASPWTEWTIWNTCSAACGNCGIHQRTRHKIGTLPNGQNCAVREYFQWEKQFCNPIACDNNSTRTCCRNHVVQSKGVEFICVPPP
ncbi:hypothetical protein QR680_004704 [Steinernema hermaphroditum]|uniref:Peptidase S1 domain-containing protein n=1 Tax=Steinernema hermaphroditum TaxID=289476 RepID=A0AA39HQQ9_9BILA|nr:hypothetical protein QR680_004704 [Steinernema hermaphroditum]